eukprot:710153-Prymnesium_polylepis.1
MDAEAGDTRGTNWRLRSYTTGECSPARFARRGDEMRGGAWCVSQLRRRRAATIHHLRPQ